MGACNGTCGKMERGDGFDAARSKMPPSELQEAGLLSEYHFMFRVPACPLPSTHSALLPALSPVKPLTWQRAEYLAQHLAPAAPPAAQQSSPSQLNLSGRPKRPKLLPQHLNGDWENVSSRQTCQLSVSITDSGRSRIINLWNTNTRGMQLLVGQTQNVRAALDHGVATRSIFRRCEGKQCAARRHLASERRRLQKAMACWDRKLPHRCCPVSKSDFMVVARTKGNVLLQTGGYPQSHYLAHVLQTCDSQV